MTNGNYVHGNRAELAILTTEASLTHRGVHRVPASYLLNCIARDAFAAVLRDDAEAVAALPAMVQFKAHAIKSCRHPGAWRLVIIAKSCGAWGSCMCPAYSESRVKAMAEMINGPVITNPVSAIPPAFSNTPVPPLDVLGAWLRAMRSNQPSAAADGIPHEVQEKRKANAPLLASTVRSQAAA